MSALTIRKCINKMQDLPGERATTISRRDSVSLRGVFAKLLTLALAALVVAFVVEAVLSPSDSGRVLDTALSPGSNDHCNADGFALLSYDKILHAPYQFEATGASIDWTRVSQISREVPRPIWFEGSLNNSSQTCPGERGQILQTIVGHDGRTGEYLEVIGIIVPPQKPFPYSLVGALGG